MSFGYSVGDFIAVLQLANELRTRFIDAPKQFKAISDEVRSLSIILGDVKIVLDATDILPERDLTDEKKDLRSITEGCRNVLTELNKILGKYDGLDASPKSFRSKSLLVWKRLTLKSEDINDLRSRIVSNISLLNAFNGQLTKKVSSAIKDGVDQLNQRHDDQERQQERRVILDWLTPMDYSTQQSDFISRRQEGTGQWLLNSNEFQDWLKKSKRTLFCPGMPGAGKTIMTAVVVDHLNRIFENDASIGIAYIYCNYQRQHEQTPADLLMSLLKHLMLEQPSVPEKVKTLYDRHKDKRTRPSFDEISKVLHSIVADYSRAFIIVDALDECKEEGRRSLLSEIFCLQAETGASLFTTSRDMLEITKEFKGSISLEIRASDEDVRRYLDGHMSRLKCVSQNLALQEKIKTEITKAVDGMFLLAHLHLDSLSVKTTPKEIKLALAKLPKGSEALEHAYTKAIERIEGQEDNFRKLARRILLWITHVRRPLTTLELRHALAVEVGKPELDEDNLTSTDLIISVCAGLVTVDEKSDIIRFVHYTTQEYFERIKGSWIPDAQTDITMTCVTYLLFDAFEAGFCPTHKEFETRLQLNPLYDYAARNWGHHARAASTKVENLIIGLLESEAKVSASSQALMAIANYSDYSQRVPRQMTGGHLAAYFGLTEATIALLKNRYDANSKDTYGQTALWWAAENGHEAVVQLLLEHKADVDINDGFGGTALSRAAENGHEAVVRLLLEHKADVDINDGFGRTALSRAAKNGHEAVVRLLLEHKADVDIKDGFGETALSWAAENGHEAVVRLLLEHKADVDTKDNDGTTALQVAVGS